MRSLHADLVPLCRILRVVLAVASFLMAALTAHGEACRAGVLVGYIKAATETNIPVVKVFCVILLAGGRGLSRQLGALGRWADRSKRPMFLIPTTRLSWQTTTVSSTTACSSSPPLVGLSSVTSGG